MSHRIGNHSSKRTGHEFLVHGLVVIAWPVDGNGKRRSPWPARICGIDAWKSCGALQTKDNGYIVRYYYGNDVEDSKIFKNAVYGFLSYDAPGHNYLQPFPTDPRIARQLFRKYLELKTKEKAFNNKFTDQIFRNGWLQACKIVFGSSFSLESTDNETNDEKKEGETNDAGASLSVTASTSSSSSSFSTPGTPSSSIDPLVDTAFDASLRLRLASYVGPLGYPSPNDTSSYTRFMRKGTMFRDKQILSYSFTAKLPSVSSLVSSRNLLLAYEFVLPPSTTEPPEYLYLEDYDVPVPSGTVGAPIIPPNVTIGLPVEEDTDRLRECYVRGVEVKELTMTPEDRALLEQFGPSLVNPGNYIEIPIADIIGSEEPGTHLFFATQFDAIFKKGKMKALAHEHERLLEESRASALLSVLHGNDGGGSENSGKDNFTITATDLSPVSNLLFISKDSSSSSSSSSSLKQYEPAVHGITPRPYLAGGNTGETTEESSGSKKRKRGRPAGSPSIKKTDILPFSDTSRTDSRSITVNPSSNDEDAAKGRQGRPPNQILKLYSASTPKAAENTVTAPSSNPSPSKIVAALPRLPRVDATSHFADIMASAFNEDETVAPQNTHGQRVASIGLRLSSSSTTGGDTKRNVTEDDASTMMTTISNNTLPSTATAVSFATSLIPSLPSSTVDAYHAKISNVALLGLPSTAMDNKEMNTDIMNSNDKTTIHLDDSTLTFAVQATSDEFMTTVTSSSPTDMYVSNSSSLSSSISAIHPNVPHITSLTELKNLTYEEFKLWLNTQIEKRLLPNLLNGLDKQNTLPVTRQGFTTLLSKALIQWSTSKEKALHMASNVNDPSAGEMGDILGSTNDFATGSFDSSSADRVLDQALEEILGIDISSSTGGWYLVAALKGLRP